MAPDCPAVKSGLSPHSYPESAQNDCETPRRTLLVHGAMVSPSGRLIEVHRSVLTEPTIAPTRIPAPAPTGTHPAQGLAPSLGALSTHASVARAPTPAPVRSPNRKPCPRRECLPRLTSSTDRGPAVIPCSTPSESLSTMRSRVQETNDPTIRRTGARHLGHTHWLERGPREKGMWLAPPPQRRELRDRARSASSHSCKRAWRRGSHATGDEWTVIASR